MRRGVATVLACALLSLAPGFAWADSGTEAALAEKAFLDGRALLKDGRVAEACEKFAESRRYENAAGTLLNLAMCYERLGRTASAWAAYRELLPMAQRAGDEARAAHARERSELLANAWPRLLVRWPASAGSGVEEGGVPRLTLLLDGAPIPPSSGPSELPLDPGKHRLELRRGTVREWVTDIEAPARNVVLEVPIRETVHVAHKSEPPTVGRTAAVVLGATGLAATLAGGIFAVTSRVHYDDARRDHCGDGACDAAGIDGIRDARRLADGATVLTVYGVAATLGAVGIWLALPKGAPEVRVGVGSVGGTF